ncbi:hypothetical protein GYO_3711 [Bacillus spizizenii TU-B-10]|uniref:Uncharacterized protein n=1 Tax=Bacillus spizizenii (strain DSM 15029 / JCM 12233 / NBRC 101239 / NRRL B-23049 / TU-B-10) TaxID=1052585 RepID=G4P0V7_BACS4|nr:hypothetical protein GYO_3711 [Bacillus spizizenii TU-B-10]
MHHYSTFSHVYRDIFVISSNFIPFYYKICNIGNLYKLVDRK